MKIGDTVRIVGSKSVMALLLGKTGVITGRFGPKLVVLIEPADGERGSLSHTALPEDLELIKAGVEGDAARQHP
ncbi:hypothetical protein [Paenibacillus sp. P22]|uniref:hypothetical protein n=1 Tax=Paenibacillus sp. P22 TaxID=483908 RepID=UPI0003FDE053|nr:hypothetical protein [Paenibacillus sp. P22]CDN44860.1 hypothetical protein BN871_FT_00120 [Paenibacillus sp. P22]